MIVIDLPMRRFRSRSHDSRLQIFGTRRSCSLTPTASTDKMMGLRLYSRITASDSASSADWTIFASSLPGRHFRQQLAPVAPCLVRCAHPAPPPSPDTTTPKAAPDLDLDVFQQTDDPGGSLSVGA